MVLWDYYYFGSKDHEQCLEKAWYVTKLGILGGSGFTTFWLLYHPGFPQTATFVGKRWIRYTVPMTAALILGSTASCIISRLRGNKDDCWNYMAGFMTTSPIWTVKFRNSGKGTTFAAFSALVMCMLKIHDEHDAGFITHSVFGRKQHDGTFGGENAGDFRWLTPGLLTRDPGRRPPF